MKASTDGSVSICDIKAGDVFWECEGGQDGCFIALTNATREGQGFGLFVRDILTRERHHFFEADRSGQGRLCLYNRPEYTRPDYAALLDGLAAVLREEAEETAKQAKAREEGLSLAATQCSESRDIWMAKAKARQEEIDGLKEVIAEMMDIASRNLNGITMGQRIREVLHRSVFVEESKA